MPTESSGWRADRHRDPALKRNRAHGRVHTDDNRRRAHTNSHSSRVNRGHIFRKASDDEVSGI